MNLLADFGRALGQVHFRRQAQHLANGLLVDDGIIGDESGGLQGLSNETGDAIERTVHYGLHPMAFDIGGVGLLEIAGFILLNGVDKLGSSCVQVTLPVLL